VNDKKGASSSHGLLGAMKFVVGDYERAIKESELAANFLPATEPALLVIFDANQMINQFFV